MVKRKFAESVDSEHSEVSEKSRNVNHEPIPCGTSDIAAAFELLGQSLDVLSKQLKDSGSTKVVQKHVWQPLAENEDVAPLLLDSFVSGVSAILALSVKEIIANGSDYASPNSAHLAENMMENLVNFMPVID